MDSQGRSKNWLFIIYPDSAAFNWKEVLQDLKVQCFISPLHDHDVWTDDDQKKNKDHIPGEFKKPHYHGIMCYSSKKTYEAFVSDMNIIKAVVDPIPFKAACADIVTSVHYLIHDGWPTKYQYDKTGIEAYCGSNVSKYFDINNDEWQNCMIEVEAYIREQKIFEFSDLWKHCCIDQKDWMIAIRNSRGIVQDYIRSFRNGYYNSENISSDSETGEIK